MTKTLLTSVAAGAILLGAAVAPAAFAQDTTQPAQPETHTQMKTDQSPAMPDASADPVKPMDNAQTTPSTDPAVTTAMDKTYLTEQSPDEISANTYIGQSVYNAADESIGSIHDLIIEKDGGITAAVIGVGGFLGIGEKWVAVPFGNISIAQAPDGGEVKLTTTETAESLQAAPEFKTLTQKVAERSTVDTTATGSTTMAPAPATPAPAPTTEPAN
ncbi:PRC-barrel domain-containing protein [Mycoplana ramosa]|uniref:PRC-barrel domain-containing protein n=1 Tax=Mycoplana ramosa TaxID=40837 RepID=A0ABW3YU38_MYCRA